MSLKCLIEGIIFKHEKEEEIITGNDKVFLVSKFLSNDNLRVIGL